MGTFLIRPAEARRRMAEAGMTVDALIDRSTDPETGHKLSERTVKYIRSHQPPFKPVTEAVLEGLARGLGCDAEDLLFGPCSYGPESDLAEIDEQIARRDIGGAVERLKQLAAAAVVHHREAEAQCLLGRVGQTLRAYPRCRPGRPDVRLVEKPKGPAVGQDTRRAAHQRRREYHRSRILCISPIPGRVHLYVRPGPTFADHLDLFGGHEQVFDAEDCPLHAAVRQAHEEAPLFFGGEPVVYPSAAFRQIGPDHVLKSERSTNQEYTSVFVLRPPRGRGYANGFRHVSESGEAQPLGDAQVRLVAWEDLISGALSDARLADGLSRVIEKCGHRDFKDELGAAICSDWGCV